MKVYQISSWIGQVDKDTWFTRRKKEFDALPTAAKISVGTAALAGGTIMVGAAMKAMAPETDQVTIIDNLVELEKFIHREEDEFKPGSFYIAHPKQKNLLIPTSSFHGSIAKEQMSDIVAFLRSKLPVTRIEVVMEDLKRGGLNGRAPQSGVDDAGLNFEHLRVLRLLAEYNEPKRVPLGQLPLLWIDQFKIIQESVKGANAGIMVFEDSADLSFGLNAKFAKTIGIEANWLSKKQVTVNVKFG